MKPEAWGKCGTCEHWDEHPDEPGRWGICQRVTDPRDFDPWTQPDDTCPEYQASRAARVVAAIDPRKAGAQRRGRRG